jgi:hypothetical protein
LNALGLRVTSSRADDVQRTSAPSDRLVAFLARLRTASTKKEQDEAVALMQGVHNNHPGFLQAMFDQAETDRRRAANGPPDFGPVDPYAQGREVNIPDEAQSAMEVFPAKLGKALYFMYRGAPLPRDGEVRFSWFTNATLDGDMHSAAPRLI